MKACFDESALLSALLPASGFTSNDIRRIDDLLFEKASRPSHRIGLQYFAEPSTEPDIDRLLAMSRLPHIRQSILDTLGKEISGSESANRELDAQIYRKYCDEISTAADEKEIRETIEQLIEINPSHFLPFRYELNDEEFPGSMADFECSPNTDFPKQPRTLLCKRYICGKSGIYTALANSPGAPDKFVSRSYILPIAEYEDVDGGGASVEIAYCIEGTQDWKSLTIPQSAMRSSAEIIKYLADKRIDIRTKTAGLISDYISDILSQNRAFGLIETQKNASKLGWHGNEFVPYSADITVSADDATMAAVHTSGSLSECLADVSGLWRDHKSLRIVCAASLAAPLVSLFRELSFCVNVWGETGCGKTVLLKAAASMWGDPHEGAFLHSLNATLNATVGALETLNSLPAILDEGQVLDRRVSPETLVYQLTEGESRRRCDVTGTVRATRTWNTVAILSGERALTGDHSAAGALNRVFEIELSRGTLNQSDCVKILRAVQTNYGHVGKLFIELIQNTGREEIQKSQCEYCDRFLENGSEGKRASAAAWLMYAEHFVSEKIMHCEPLPFEDWLQIAQSDVPVSTAERAKQFVVSWVTSNEAHFLRGEASADAYTIYGKYVGGELIVVYDVLSRVLHEKGFNFAQVRSDWAEMNFLQTFKNGDKKVYTNPRKIFNSGKRPQCCIFNWSDDD